MSSTGATSTSMSRRASRKPVGAPGSGGTAGDDFGRKIAMPIR